MISTAQKDYPELTEGGKKGKECDNITTEVDGI